MSNLIIDKKLLRKKRKNLWKKVIDRCSVEKCEFSHFYYCLGKVFGKYLFGVIIFDYLKQWIGNQRKILRLGSVSTQQNYFFIANSQKNGLLCRNIF